MIPAGENLKAYQVAGLEIYQWLEEGEELIFSKCPANIDLIERHGVTLRQRGRKRHRKGKLLVMD
jgi:hypothetical protein